jgi:N-acetylneuraminic acid mutarotase
VANFQVLRQGLSSADQAIVLDAAGDGLQDMAAALAGRHDLAAILVVAHGAPGAIALGSTVLSEQTIGSYEAQLAALGAALRAGGELDLWSCDVAGGASGAALVRDLAAATGARIAAADHLIGSSNAGGSWQLDVRTAGARPTLPFTSAALGVFQGSLGWSSAASLTAARDNHTATLLTNGKVLVVGGQNVNGVLSSAELYDPATNSWSSAASLTAARDNHTATLLTNGKVLVVGGQNSSGDLSSTELYDPTTNSWSSAGNLATPRSDATATLLPNGKVLVAGGFEFFIRLASAELYDPVTNSWSSAGAMATARYSASAVLLGSGKVLVAGGSGSSGVLPSAELYDAVTNSWSSAGNLATGCYDFTTTLLGNGNVLAAGGLDKSSTTLSSAELYDPSLNSWSSAGNMAAARSSHTATLLAGGKVLVTGGSANSASLSVLSSAELYDPSNGSWSSAGNMAVGVAFQTATLLAAGTVLVAGGQDGSGASVSAAQLYTTAAAGLQVSALGISGAEGHALNNVKLATFTDSDTTVTTANLTATINWGDGSSGSGTVTGTSGSFTVTGSHSYAEEAGSNPGSAFTTTVTINETKNNVTASATSSATITDAALAQAAPQPAVAPPMGQSFTGPVASFSDGDPNAAVGDYTATINWGDGHQSTGSVVANGSGGFNVIGTNTYNVAGTMPISVAISDAGGASLTVNNTAQVASPPGLQVSALAISGTEGQALNNVKVATFTDSDTTVTTTNLTATINWGDGTSGSGTVSGTGGNFTVTGSHTYAEETSSALSTTVTINETKNNLTASATSSATISDAALPQAAPQPAVAPTMGQPFTGPVASFSDADPNAAAGDYTATINWGDGHQTTGSVVANGSGGFNVIGTNTYNVAGTMPISVTVTDSGGASVSINNSGHVPATLQVTGLGLAATEGKAFNNAVVATLTDTDPTVTTADLSATINWGDGTSSSGTVTGASGNFSVAGSHSYAQEAAGYTITVTIHEAKNSLTSGGTASAAVSDASLSQAAVQPTVLANPGLSFTGAVASFSDGNPNASASDFTATINWGDGHQSNGTIAANPAGGFNVVGTNLYSAISTVPVSVVITDSGGASVTFQNTARVGDKDFRYVAQVYVDLLGRPTDLTGLVSFGTALDSGALTRLSVAQTIENSNEFRALEVTQAYQQILHRAPDATGLANAVTFLSAGGNINNVRAGLFASNEFFSLAQKSTITSLTTHDQKFVDAVFVTALNRHADTTALTEFTALADQGFRFAVAFDVLTGPEGYSVDVTNSYLKILRRAPDSAGLTGFVGELLNGSLREEGVLALLASSDEYFARIS